MYDLTLETLAERIEETLPLNEEIHADIEKLQLSVMKETVSSWGPGGSSQFDKFNLNQ